MTDPREFGMFVRHDETGQIVAWHRNRGDSPHPSFQVRVPEAEIPFVQHRPDRFLVQAGRIVRKPVVRLLPTATAIEPGEVATVRLVDVPAEIARVRVQVNGERLEVDRDEPIEVSSQHPGIIIIRLREPRMHSEPVRIMVRRGAVP